MNPSCLILLPGGRPARQPGQHGLRGIWLDGRNKLLYLDLWLQDARGWVQSPRQRGPRQSQNSTPNWVVQEMRAWGECWEPTRGTKEPAREDVAKKTGSEWAAGKVIWASWRGECCPWVGFGVFLEAICESGSKIHVEVVGRCPKLLGRYPFSPCFGTAAQTSGCVEQAKPYSHLVSSPGNWDLMGMSLRILLWATETKSG